MDWLNRMNQVLAYIEDHLEGTIDYEDISQISLCPGSLFQRMFSNFTNISLSEYIRKRKLSQAAMALVEEDVSVIDIAMRYGYNSPDAFSYAFKRMHGISPSQAKKNGESLVHYPKLSFIIQMKGDIEMKYKIIEKEAFTVVGKSLRTTQEENMKEGSISQFWGRSYDNGVVRSLCALEPNKPLLGMCYNDEADGHFSYLIGVESNKSIDTFDTLKISKAKWAVFESIGPLPGAIQNVWKDIFQNFLPSSPYDHAPMPDFELYPDSNLQSEDYFCEVWIPIIAKK